MVPNETAHLKIGMGEVTCGWAGHSPADVPWSYESLEENISETRSDVDYLLT
jgi:hypothetical protein